MNYIYVANWKMNFSFNQSINFCKHNGDALQKLVNSNTTIIICPSAIALAPIADLFKKSPIFIGAQNCSQHASGPYTGEISAQSLAEVGATFCIVGHSERRTYFNETNEEVAAKANLLITHNIQPIICIGETKSDFENKQTHAVLTQQLNPIFKAIQSSNTNPSVIVAYEPVWSIGTGTIPEHSYLENIFAWLKEFITLSLPNQKTHLVYGGSVDQTNIIGLKKIPFIEGFLIGGASTDIQTFTNIIQP